jgi:hypothetical protein
MSVFTGLYTKEKLKLRSQSFSSTDLKIQDDGNGLGIVYPVLKPSQANQPSISIIVDHEKNDTILAKAEYRVINEVEDKVVYSKGTCISIVSQPTLVTTTSLAQKLVGIDETKVIKESYVVKNKDTAISGIEEVLNSLLSSLDFEPAYLIDENNLKQKEIKFEYSYLDKDLDNMIYMPFKSKEKPKRSELEKAIRKKRTKLKSEFKKIKYSYKEDKNIKTMIDDDLGSFTDLALVTLLSDLEDLEFDMLLDLDDSNF